MTQHCLSPCSYEGASRCSVKTQQYLWQAHSFVEYSPYSLHFLYLTGVTKKCHPGLHTPVPAGFYLNDVWTSFVCSTRRFTMQTTTQCLKDKHIYMMGDSTMRQWFEFFVKAVPSEITYIPAFINSLCLLYDYSSIIAFLSLIQHNSNM